MKAGDDTEKLYNNKASFYQKVFIGFLNWGKELDKFFRKNEYLKANMKILDAGCGTGVVTKTLYQIANQKGYTGIRFYGFDLSENMLKIFQQWITLVNADNIELAKANVLDAESLPIGWNSFDLIVSSTMLEYLPRDKVKDALYTMRKMLKPEGKMVVIITKRNLLTALIAGKWWKANLYKKAEIKQAFNDAGLEKIEFRKFSFTWSSAIIVIEGKKEK